MTSKNLPSQNFLFDTSSTLINSLSSERKEILGIKIRDFYGTVVSLIENKSEIQTAIIMGLAGILPFYINNYWIYRDNEDIFVLMDFLEKAIRDTPDFPKEVFPGRMFYVDDGVPVIPINRVVKSLFSDKNFSKASNPLEYLILFVGLQQGIESLSFETICNVLDLGDLSPLLD